MIGIDELVAMDDKYIHATHIHEQDLCSKPTMISYWMSKLHS